MVVLESRDPCCPMEKAKGAAEGHVRHDRVVARAKEGDHHRVDGGHPGTEGAGVRSAFERREPGFECPHCRVVRT